jgi:predicted Zn-dependent peptidase
MVQSAVISGAVEKFAVDGIDVIVKPNSANEIVAAQFCLRGGIAHYGKKQAGIEAVLFRTAMEETANYPKEKLRSELARMGTAISTNAGHDYTAVELQCLRRHLEKSWSILADVIAHPLCRRADVELVKQRQQNDIRQHKSDPDQYARLLSDALFFRGHPYAVSPRGTEETVGSFSAEALLAYHKKHVSKARALVVFVGDVERTTAERLVREYLDTLPDGTYANPTLPTPEGITAVKHKLEARELPTNYVRGIFAAPAPDNVEDAVPMFVGLDILRDRLFEEVRTKRNLTYAVTSAMADRRSNYGLLYVTSNDPAQAMTIILNEVKAIQDEPVPAKALHDKIKVLTTEMLMAEQANSGQASHLALHEISGRGFAWADKRIELIRQVTAAEIQRVTGKYIKNIGFCVLGDPVKGRQMLEAITGE